jgi:hypothetical protein
MAPEAPIKPLSKGEKYPWTMAPAAPQTKNEIKKEL